MPPSHFSLFGIYRQPDQHSHGQHLAPEDAHEDYSNRRRRKHESDDREPRRRSADYSYRSDHDKERRRRSADHGDRSGNDSKNNHPRNWSHQSRNPRRSAPKSHGEHRFDDYEIDNRERGRNRYSEKALLGEQLSIPGLPTRVSSRRYSIGEHHLHDTLSIQRPRSVGHPSIALNDELQKAPAESRTYNGHRSDQSTHVQRSQSARLSNRNSRRSSRLTAPEPNNYTEIVADHIPLKESTPYDNNESRPDPASNYRRHSRRMSTPPEAGDHAFIGGEDDLHSPESTRSPLSQGTSFTNVFPEIQTPTVEVSEYQPNISPSNLRRQRSISLPPAPPPPSGSVLGQKTYRYQPLKHWEFRLVRVFPERMSTLKCEISHFSLDNAPGYIAISYAWGDGIDTKELILGGATVPVAVSLYDALTAVRQKKEPVYIWIDALSIDQQNKTERATQVRLMSHIYGQAAHVAIWLGPDADESRLATQLLHQVAEDKVSLQRIGAPRTHSDSAALLALFKRDYWKRLWVVQEVLLAEKKLVYCGQSIFPWEVYRKAAEAFWDENSDPHIRQGPSSFPDKYKLKGLGDASLLEVMRACRKKLSENPRDKVFGILGLLSEATQEDFPVDYSQSIQKVYTDVVDHLLSTTDQLDVIRESIYFPLHVNTTKLPSWCPDWAHIPEVSSLRGTPSFEASRGTKGPTKAEYQFQDQRRKLEITAIKIDTIKATGVAVGTFCASQDYLMAFLNWRAILLHEFHIEPGNKSHPLHKVFCRTLCLGNVQDDQIELQTWHHLCYNLFASLIKEKLPCLHMDADLEYYANITGLLEPDTRRKFLQDHFGDRMTGRSFCITEEGLIGMGSGFMTGGDLGSGNTTGGDLVVIPFGCSTPILLRPAERKNEYHYVGDVYIDGYMHGEAIRQMEAGDKKRQKVKYVLC